MATQAPCAGSDTSTLFASLMCFTTADQSTIQRYVCESPLHSTKTTPSSSRENLFPSRDEQHATVRRLSQDQVPAISDGQAEDQAESLDFGTWSVAKASNLSATDICWFLTTANLPNSETVACTLKQAQTFNTGRASELERVGKTIHVIQAGEDLINETEAVATFFKQLVPTVSIPLAS